MDRTTQKNRRYAPCGTISCFFVLHGFSFFRLDLVDCFHQCFNIQVGVDTFGERHGTGVSNNLLDRGLVYMGFCQHGDAGMPGTVRRLVISKLLHQGCEVTVVAVSYTHLDVYKRQELSG